MEPLKYDFDFNELGDRIEYTYDPEADIYIINKKYYVLNSIKKEGKLCFPSDPVVELVSVNLKYIDVDIYEVVFPQGKYTSEQILNIKDLKTSEYLYNKFLEIGTEKELNIIVEKKGDSYEFSTSK